VAPSLRRRSPIEARMPRTRDARVHVRFLAPARPDIPLTIAIETHETRIVR
jgi:hypothetical protein